MKNQTEIVREEPQWQASFCGKQTSATLLAQAEYIYRADGQWERAIELYTNILIRDQKSDTPPQWRQVWMGFSCCFYEMGVYDKAIHSGTIALEMRLLK